MNCYTTLTYIGYVQHIYTYMATQPDVTTGQIAKHTGLTRKAAADFLHLMQRGGWVMAVGIGFWCVDYRHILPTTTSP